MVSNVILFFTFKRKNKLFSENGVESVGRESKIIAGPSVLSPHKERHSLNHEAKYFENRNNDLDFVDTISDSCLKRKTTILSAALINVESVLGKIMFTWILIEVGSNDYYISDEFAKVIETRREKFNVSVSCLNLLGAEYLYS